MKLDDIILCRLTPLFNKVNFLYHVINLTMLDVLWQQTNNLFLMKAPT